MIRKKKYKILLLMIGLLMIIPIVSAGGLSIVGNHSFKINKTVNIDEQIIFELSNSEDFSFFNISFEDNNYIFMEEIDKLGVGESVDVTATIDANTDFTGDVRIIGFYEADIGVSDETYTVEIYFIDGVNPCDFSIIKGDTVIWENFDDISVDLFNIVTSTPICSLNKNESHPQNFPESLILNYRASWFAGVYTKDCRITVLSDTGITTNPDFDAIINLEIVAAYNPTTIETTFLETNYTLDVFMTEEGLFLIKNTGDEIAKNIFVEGNWFKDIIPNNFDLNPGYSRTIAYKVNPIIEETNQTGKTHYKNLTISGNFETIVQIFSIYINYANLEEYDSGDSLIDILIKYCEENPEVSFCRTGPDVVYGSGNQTSENMTQEQFKAILEFWFGKFSNVDNFIDWSKENFYSISKNISEQTSVQQNISDKLTSIEESRDSSNALLYIVFIVVVMIFIVVIAMKIFRVKKREKGGKLLQKFFASRPG